MLRRAIRICSVAAARRVSTSRPDKSPSVTRRFEKRALDETVTECQNDSRPRPLPVFAISHGPIDLLLNRNSDHCQTDSIVIIAIVAFMLAVVFFMMAFTMLFLMVSCPRAWERSGSRTAGRTCRDRPCDSRGCRPLPIIIIIAIAVIVSF